MNFEQIEKNNIMCVSIISDKIVITDSQSALDLLMSAKYDMGTKNIVIDKKLIVEDFFTLSTELAGEILQKYVNYGGRIAIYGDFSHYTSKPLKDFIYESNKYTDEIGKSSIICEDSMKTKATKRTLPLIPHIEKLLRNKKEQQKYFSELLHDSYNKNYLEFVCTDDFGNIIKPDYVTSHFRHIVDKNGLKYLRFHDLRHTCASLLVANHISLKAIQDWLGHANFQTTANIYSHLDFSSRVESADMISNILGDAETGINTDYKMPNKEKRGRKKKNKLCDTAENG